MFSQQNNSQLKRFTIAFVILFTTIAGGAFAIWQFGGMSIQSQGLVFNAQLVPSERGQTVLVIPPFGEVIASTHKGPVELKISLEKIETQEFTSKLEKMPSAEKYVANVKNGITSQIKLFYMKQFIVGMLGVLIVLALLLRLSPLRVLKYSLAAGFTLTALLAYSFHSYDYHAFSEPEFRGTMKMAPRVMETVRETLNDFEKLRGQTGVVVGNIKELFEGADNLAGLDNSGSQDDSIVVLLVSDLHTNPVGVEFMRNIAEQFKVDMLINAGDLSDMGTMPEANLIAEIEGIGVPQVLVSGNHDTEAIMELFAGLPGIQVADKTPLEVMGLKVLGWPDNLSDTQEVEYADDNARKEALEKQAEDIRNAIMQQGMPDILVVHNESVAAKLVDLAPLVVTGHTHSAKLLNKNGHVVINPGTVGAAGFRGLSSKAEVPYSAAIVYYKPGIGPVSCDMIKYNPESRQFLLERQVIAQTSENMDAEQ